MRAKKVKNISQTLFCSVFRLFRAGRWKRTLIIYSVSAEYLYVFFASTPSTLFHLLNSVPYFIFKSFPGLGTVGAASCTEVGILPFCHIINHFASDSYRSMIAADVIWISVKSFEQKRFLGLHPHSAFWWHHSETFFERLRPRQLLPLDLIFFIFLTDLFFILFRRFKRNEMISHILFYSSVLSRVKILFVKERIVLFLISITFPGVAVQAGACPV